MMKVTMKPLRLNDNRGTEQLLCRTDIDRGTVVLVAPEDGPVTLNLAQTRELREFLSKSIDTIENQPCPSQQPLFPGLLVAEAK